MLWPRNIPPAFEAILPLLTQSTDFRKTSIEGNEKLVYWIHPWPLSSRALSIDLLQQAMEAFYRFGEKLTYYLLLAALVSATIAILASLVAGIRIWPNLTLAATVLR